VSSAHPFGLAKAMPTENSVNLHFQFESNLLRRLAVRVLVHHIRTLLQQILDHWQLTLLEVREPNVAGKGEGCVPPRWRELVH